MRGNQYRLQTRAAVMRVLILLATTLAGSAVVEAYEFEPDERHPVPEIEPGVNLYWHLPGAYWEADCDEVISTDQFGQRPNWYVTGDLQTLFRDNLRAFDYATLGASGPGVLSNSDFDDAFEAGARVTIGRSLGDWYRLEVSYLGGYRWTDRAVLRNDDPNTQGGTGNLFTALSGFGDPPTLGLDYNNLTEMTFSTKLDNLELNIRRRFSVPPGPFETSFLLGLRFLRLDEATGYHTESAVPLPLGAINDSLVTTSNDMVGVHVGMMGQWIATDRSWVDFEVKGAFFSNSIDLDTNYQNTDENGVVTLFTDRDNKTGTAYLLELSLLYNYNFTRALTFRAGYSAMWMYGAALASDNMSTNATRLTRGPILIDNRGRIAFHGPTIGLVAAW